MNWFYIWYEELGRHGLSSRLAYTMEQAIDLLRRDHPYAVIVQVDK